MAEQEEVIVTIKIDEEEAQQRIIQLRSQMESLTETKKNLAAAFKAGQITQEEYAEELARTEVSMRAAKQELTNVTKGQEVNNNSINALRESTRRLTQERNNLDLSTEQGRKRLVEINTQLDENTETIRRNMDAATKQKMNIGNYKDALGDLFPAFGQVTQGVEGTGKAMRVLSANPLMLALTAIVGVLALLYKAFTSTAAGADMVENVMATLSAVFDVLIDRVAMIAGALVDFFSGNWSDAADKMSGAFSGVGDEIANAAKEAVALKNAMRDLEDAQIDFEVASAETENTIKRLINQSKDRTLSEEERMKKIEEAVALEKKRVAEEVKLADDALNIASREAAQRLNIKKKASETEIEFGKRVLEAFKADNAAQADDLRDKVKEMLIARQSAEGKSLEFQEKIQAKSDALEEKAQEKREKAAEKAREIYAKNAKAKVDFELYGLAQKAKAFEEEKVIDDASLESFKQTEKNRLDVLIQIEQKILDEVKKNSELTKMERQLAIQKQNDKILELTQEHNEKIAKEEENLKKIREKNNQDIINLEVFRLESQAKKESEETEKGLNEKYRLLETAELTKSNFLLQNDELTATQRELIKAQSDERLIALENEKNDKLKVLEDKRNADIATAELLAKTTRLGNAKAIIGGLSGLLKEGSAAAKVAALADIGINTALGFIQGLDIAQKTAKAAGPGAAFAFPIFYAQQIAAVLGAASRAKGLLGFAEGGLTGTRVDASHGIPITRSNGDNILATIKTGEVILNQRQQAMLGGSSTFRRIGVPGFADGGLVSDISLANSSRAIGFNDIVAKLNEQKTVLVLEDFQAASSRQYEAERAAIV